MKSEPSTFGIDDLRACPSSTDHWDGVRNYQARNMMRDEMQPGDLVYFYHSNCKPPGIAGVAEVVRRGYPDHTALDPESPYYDPKASEDNPRWFMVDVKFKQKFNRLLSLDEIKTLPDMQDFALLSKGNRLSVMPVPAKAWRVIMKVAHR